MSIKRPLLELASDPARFDHLSFQACGLLLDLSKQRLDAEALNTLLALAEEQELADARERLFTGGIVNVSEGRAAHHTILRAPAATQPAEVSRVHDEMGSFATRVREARWLGATGKAITDVVHIGIGGSHLGPQLAWEALQHPPADGPNLHFVANIDPQALESTLSRLDPQRTLFVVASKSFGTLETKVNAESARSWLLERLGNSPERLGNSPERLGNSPERLGDSPERLNDSPERLNDSPERLNNSREAVARHFVAVSANPEAAAAFGIPEANRFELWDWVGGRFSLWSAVGLPLMLGLGTQGFAELLAGAEAMDEHFRTEPAPTNLPLLMALCGIWNYNFLGVTNHAILPYSERLALLPDYLQQLMMESNGKRVHVDGEPVSIHTMPIVWGGPGTSGQHAYHQLLHQGTRSFTADFVINARDEHGLGDHQRWLNANALGQSQALMRGDSSATGHRALPGNHATTTIVLPGITPRSLGALLALYEHCVFCQGVIWNINSFDQWGVELGKRLALPIFEQLAGASALQQDAPTRGLIDTLRRHDASADEKGSGAH